jgi:catechol 2,3-dioxygenase-like lactoylglutathione lyase family enzyme
VPTVRGGFAVPAITDRSSKKPLLNVSRLGHGTLESADLAASRRFYEEVLGLDVVQTSPRSLLVRKGYDHSYAVVESGRQHVEMEMLNHNGLEVGSREEVDRAFELLTQVKEEYGIRRVVKPHYQHGDYSCYCMDLDGNWWEIVAVGPQGYAIDFKDPSYDLTGRHDLDLRTLDHTHDPKVRELLKR